MDPLTSPRPPSFSPFPGPSELELRGCPLQPNSAAGTPTPQDPATFAPTSCGGHRTQVQLRILLCPKSAAPSVSPALCPGSPTFSLPDRQEALPSKSVPLFILPCPPPTTLLCCLEPWGPGPELCPRQPSSAAAGGDLHVLPPLPLPSSGSCLVCLVGLRGPDNYERRGQGGADCSGFAGFFPASCICRSLVSTRCSVNDLLSEWEQS